MITLQPGGSDIYNEDGTLYYKLDCYSKWDASEHISDLTSIVKSSDLDNAVRMRILDESSDDDKFVIKE